MSRPAVLSEDAAIDALISEIGNWFEQGRNAQSALIELSKRLELLMSLPDMEEEFNGWADRTVDLIGELVNRIGKGLVP